ncbi:metal ABC transporter permease [Campylobacter troglodytis]|uniref:metal ABC transporter permease n=1 Tax=Campylobacter troglodytis TaxID=654363 RepID=UPI00115B84F6|nr:metal ABC transporter permease [Campylobacter troglodytis]TQR60656.1 hypothetical protein DMC01_04835 [Campylobacter troglodytis]
MLDILSYSFFQNALLGAFLVSIACGIMGSLIMINRLFSMAGGITHAAFGGIGIAFYFSLPILASVSSFTLLVALLVAWLSQNYPHRSDSIIAVIWAFGMAFGLILVDLSAGYQSDIMAYLFGSILAVSSADLWLLIIADLVFILLVACFYKQFVAISFDKEFASLRGVAVGFFYYLLIIMMAFCIVVCIRAVGLILIIALLSVPCFIAEACTKRLWAMMIIACVLSAIFCISGLFLSYVLNLSGSASIIIVACLGFFLTVLGKKLFES